MHAHEFEKPTDQSIVEPALLGLPSHRVGYSDRTAWLMATMSQLAYFRFESTQTITEIAAELAEMSGRDQIVRYLQDVLAGLEDQSQHGRRRLLSDVLRAAGFELVDVFDVGSTQAFLAHRPADNPRDNMLVLAFRGTEKKLGDWKTDLKAELVPARDQNKVGRIHKGFQEAYYSVESALEERLRAFPECPLYVTGHSLGGALAVVATRYLDAGKLAACYTFGSPRVGDLDLAKVFKTPIYRVVNASDAVPRIPFGSGYALLVRLVKAVFSLLPAFRFLNRFYVYMDKISGYVHYGDQRYLTVSEPGPNDTYPDLNVISNPNFFLRAERFWKRARATKGQRTHQGPFHRDIPCETARPGAHAKLNATSCLCSSSISDVEHRSSLPRRVAAARQAAVQHHTNLASAHGPIRRPETLLAAHVLSDRRSTTQS